MKLALCVLLVAILGVSLAAASCDYQVGDDIYSFNSISSKEYTDDGSLGPTMHASFCDDLPVALCPKTMSQCSAISKSIGSGVPVASNSASPLPSVITPSSGETWKFGLKYTNAPSEKCPNRTTIIQFSCAQTEAAQFTTKQVSDCDYTMAWSTPLACEPSGKAGSAGLSGGAIFLIVFFSLFAGYFVIGFIVCKFVLKKPTITESIPHLAFWAALPGLFIAGIKYVIGCFTKKKASSGGDYSDDSEYGSV